MPSSEVTPVSSLAMPLAKCMGSLSTESRAGKIKAKLVENYYPDSVAIVRMMVLF